MKKARPKRRAFFFYVKSFRLLSSRPCTEPQETHALSAVVCVVGDRTMLGTLDQVNTDNIMTGSTGNVSQFPIASSSTPALVRPEESVPNRLLRSRIVVLGTQVDDEVANSLVGQMLLLAADDPNKDITLFINSPGGSVTAGMAIYDTMNFIPCDVRTVAMGLAASMGQFLLAAGAPGKRYALPNARIMMHQPLGGIGGSASDIRIQAQQMAFTKLTLAELIAKHTNQPLEKIQADSERDNWFSAEEAAAYGLVDRVIATTAEMGDIK